MERINELHTSISSHAAILNANSSKLSRCISIHSTGSLLSLSQLDRFLNECIKVFPTKSCYNIGALVGDIVVSINLQSNSDATDTTAKKKRGYDDSYDRARESVNAARLRLQKTKSATVDDDHLNLAEDVIANMFRQIKGFNGELVIESLGLSVSPNKMFKNTNASTGTSSTSPTSPTPSTAQPPPNFSTRPQLIIACRLSGGVAIPLITLKRVLSQNEAFFDGMITTSVDSLGPEYRLPMSDLGKGAESKGQKSMLLFVAVPPPTYPRLVKMPRGENGNDDGDDDQERPTKQRRT
jgi:hypothetical protein